MCGCPITLSRPTGRADALFPDLREQQRRSLHIDAVGSYSMTDQATADDMTLLMITLAAATRQGQGTRLEAAAGNAAVQGAAVPAAVAGSAGGGGGSSAAGSTAGAGAAAVAGSGAGSAAAAGGNGAGSAAGSAQAGVGSAPHTHQVNDGRANAACGGLAPQAEQGGAASLRGGYLPGVGPASHYTLADLTACCGGNTLAAARGGFSAVTAVELDPDRAEDCLHNCLVCGWQVTRAAGVHAVTGSDRDNLAAAAGSSMQEEEAEGQAAAGTRGSGAGTGVRYVGAGMGQGVQGKMHGSIGVYEPMWSCTVCKAAAPPQAAAALGGMASASQITVVCGDAVQLLPGLCAHDVVMMDPPWGGPGYSRRKQGDEPGEKQEEGLEEEQQQEKGKEQQQKEEGGGTGEQQQAGPQKQQQGQEAVEREHEGEGAGTAGEAAPGRGGDAAGAPAASAGAAASSGGGGSSGFDLGGVPLSRLVLQLQGKAEVVALKLPSRETEEVEDLCRELWEGWGQQETAAGGGGEKQNDQPQQQGVEGEQGQDLVEQGRVRELQGDPGGARPVFMSCRFGRSLLLVVLFRGEGVMLGLQKAFGRKAATAAAAGAATKAMEQDVSGGRQGHAQEQEGKGEVKVMMDKHGEQQECGDVWVDLLELLVAPQHCCRFLQGGKMIGLRAALRGRLRKG